MKANPICGVCKVGLNDDNWQPSRRKGHDYICKECSNERKRLWRAENPEKVREQQRLWKKAHPEKVRASNTRANRKKGKRDFTENKECSAYLGVHVAERVLSHVFADVERMPYGNPGYDFICNRGKKIDVKSACLTKSKYPRWAFTIRHNIMTDYFLCLAFDNREDLNPLYAWLIPGNKLSHITVTTISPSTIHKWDEHRLDISKISDCCDAVR